MHKWTACILQNEAKCIDVLADYVFIYILISSQVNTQTKNNMIEKGLIQFVLTHHWNDFNLLLTETRRDMYLLAKECSTFGIRCFTERDSCSC